MFGHHPVCLFLIFSFLAWGSETCFGFSDCVLGFLPVLSGPQCFCIGLVKFRQRHAVV